MTCEGQYTKTGPKIVSKWFQVSNRKEQNVSLVHYNSTFSNKTKPNTV